LLDLAGKYSHFYRRKRATPKEIELGNAALQLPLSGTGKAMAHLYLADAYYERGVLTKDSDDFTKAIEASDAALQLPLPEISKGFAHGHRACAYNERGLLSKDLDDFTKAIAAGKAALLLPLPDEDKGIMQLHLSRAYLERGVFTKNSDDVTKAIAVGKAALLLPLPDEGKGIVRLHLSRAYLDRGVFTKNSDDVTKAIESGFGALLLPLSDENKGVAEGNLDRAHQHRNREKLIRRTIDLFPQDDQEELLEEAFGKYSPRTIQHGALKGKEKTTSSFASIRRGVPLFRKKIEGTKRQVKEPNERHYGMLRVAPGNDDERFRALLKATILQCSGPNEEQADKADEALKAFDTLCDGQGKTKFFPVIVDVGKALADTKGNTVPQGDSCAYWEGNGKDARLLLSCNILEHDADVSEFGALLVEANRLVTTQSPEARLPGLVNGRRVRSPEYAAAYSEARNAHKDLEKSPAYGQASAVHRSDTSAPHLEESLSRPQATLLPTGAHARASTATQRPLRPSGTRTPSPDSDLRAAIQHSEGSNEQRRAR